MGSNELWDFQNFDRLPAHRRQELIDEAGYPSDDFAYVVNEIAGGMPPDREKARQRARRVLRAAGVEGDVDEREIDDFLEPIDSPVLFDAYGRPIEPGSDASRILTTEIRFVEDELLRRLEAWPEDFRQLHPRRFEEVVAEIFSRLDYQVQLTAATRDGGKDIVAARRGEGDPRVLFIECKRYRTRKVGVAIARHLYAVVKLDGVAAGIIAATSTFTRGAKDVEQRAKGELLLRDYHALQRWLREALTPGRRHRL